MQALSAKLSWSHFKAIIYLDDLLKRDFYAEMCRIEGWNTQKKIGSMLFEHSGLSPPRASFRFFTSRASIIRNISRRP